MPYADPEKQKKAKREWARKRRAEKRKAKKQNQKENEKLLDEKIRSDPTYKALSPEKQKKIDEAFLKSLELVDIILSEKLAEAEKYLKIQVDQWAEEMKDNLNKLLAILASTQKNSKPQIVKETTKNELI